MATSLSNTDNSSTEPRSRELLPEEIIAIAAALLLQRHEGQSRYGRVSEFPQALIEEVYVEE